MNNIETSLGAAELQARIAAQNTATGAGSSAAPATQPTGSTGAPNFALALLAAKQGITLSGHAQTRLSSRQIDLSEGDFAKLSDAMGRAAVKGARSSLVLMDRPNQATVGLVVSVPNRTVITAVDTQGLKDNIFTNIDSAMIL